MHLRRLHIRMQLGGPGCTSYQQRSKSRRFGTCLASATAPSATAMILHVDQTSISFPLKAESAKDLHSSLQALLQTFAAKQKAERPQRWTSMDFRVRGGDAQDEVELLEIFCNPNSASTAFDAKALITLKTKDGVKVMTEGRLSALKADLDSFLEHIET